jgi:hypothetical protein
MILLYLKGAHIDWYFPTQRFSNTFDLVLQFEKGKKY